MDKASENGTEGSGKKEHGEDGNGWKSEEIGIYSCNWLSSNLSV